MPEEQKHDGIAVPLPNERDTTRTLFKRCLRLAQERNEAWRKAQELTAEVERLRMETQHAALEKNKTKTLTTEGESWVD